MNKGFTLIELLAVVVIMGIITTITWPAVDRAVADGKKKKYETYGDSMIAAAKVYVDNFEDDCFPINNTDKCCYVKLNTLIEQGFIKDFNNNDMSCINANSLVIIQRENGKYKYNYQIWCGKKGSIETETAKNKVFSISEISLPGGCTDF